MATKRRAAPGEEPPRAGGARARPRGPAAGARAHPAAIVASSGDAIFARTPDGVVTSWNRAAERLFGYRAAGSVGRPSAVLVPADRADELPALLARAGRGEEVAHFETVRLRKDGKPVEVSLSVSPVRDRRGRVVGTAPNARGGTPRQRAPRG